LEINVYGSKYRLYKKNAELMHVYTINDDLGVDEENDFVQYESENVKIFFYGDDILFTAAFGLTISWDGDQISDVSLCDSYNEYVCGICGNSDGEYIMTI
jgi:hypothetical protein